MLKPFLISSSLRSAIKISIVIGVVWSLSNLISEVITLIIYFYQLPHNNVVGKLMLQGLRFFPLQHLWLVVRIMLFYGFVGLAVGMAAGGSALAVTGSPETRRKRILFAFLTGSYVALMFALAYWKFCVYFPAAVSPPLLIRPLVEIVRKVGLFPFYLLVLVYILVHGALLACRFISIWMEWLQRIARFWKPVTAAIILIAAVPVLQALHPARQKNKGNNVIILCFDSLNADHLKSENYPRNTSPNFDAFRNESIFFRQAFTPVARTMPSWAGMLTGMYPHRHGIRWDLPSKARRALLSPVLLKELKKHGYFSAFMTDDSTFSYMEPDMGWDTVVQPEPGYFNFLIGYVMRMNLIEMFGNNWLGNFFFPIKKFNRAIAYTYRPEEMTDEIERMLQQLSKKDRFFLAVHFDIIHAPGTIPYPHYKYFDSADLQEPQKYIFGETDLSFLKEDFIHSLGQEEEVKRHQTLIYDRLFRTSDEQFGRIWRTIKRLNLDRNSLIFLCSDHGEKIGIVPNHGNTLHQGDEANSIILMMRLPGNGPKAVVDQLVCNVDIAPTIFSFLDFKIPEDVEGISLLPFIDGPRPEYDRSIYAETELNYLSPKACNYAPDHPTLGNVLWIYTLEPDGKIAVGEQYYHQIMSTRDFMVRSDRYKLVAFPRLDGSYEYRLYDVKTDRENKNDIKKELPSIFTSLLSALNDHLREQRGIPGPEPE